MSGNASSGPDPQPSPVPHLLGALRDHERARAAETQARFEKLEVLGEGASAITWRALDRAHGVTPDSSFERRRAALVHAGGWLGSLPPRLSLEQEDAIRAVQAHGERMRVNAPGFRQSILQDADRNRRLEVNETLDYTLALGRELGVATPTLDLCCRVLRAVSRANASLPARERSEP